MINSETFYKNLFKNNHSIMFLVNSKTSEIEDCNELACSFYGYTYDEMLKLKVTDINILTKEQVSKEMNLAKAEHRNIFYFKHRLSNGQIRDVEVNSSPIILNGKELLYSIIWDITDCNTFMDKLKEENVLLEKIIAERTYQLEETNAALEEEIAEKIKTEEALYKLNISLENTVLESTKQQLALKESEKQYRLLFENAVETIVVIQDKKIKICNPMSQELTGYKQEEFLSMSFFDLVYKEDLQGILDFHQKRLMGKRENLKHIFRIVRKDGKIRWVESDGIRISWDKNVATLNFMVDITRRKEIEDSLRISEEKFRFLIEYASDVIWIFNLEKGEFTYVSPSMYQLRGFTAEEAMMETLEDSLVPQSFSILKDAISRNVNEFLSNPKNPNNYINEVQQPCKNGRIIWVEVATKFRYNSAGEIEVLGVSRNIDERKKAEDQVLYLSYYDQLTGLYNRRFYEEELLKLDIQRNLPITLIMADVNGLKLTNDAFGHITGDKLLRTAAEILRREARTDDIIARTGGDEFVILLPKTTSIEAEIIVNRIRKTMANTKIDDIILSVSFGAATKNNMDEDIENIFTQAENFMYRRKLLESNSMKNKTVRLITKSLYEKDQKEEKHCERVSEISKKIGMAMGLSSNEINELGLLGLLHDIGKISISERILNKKGILDEDEWRELKRHPETGYQILRSVNEFAHISEFVLCHHERVDGRGYPRGLKNNQIPLQSKILSIAEAYDSMTNSHTYQEQLSEDEAIRELIDNTGSQFDLEITKVFVEKVLGKVTHKI